MRLRMLPVALAAVAVLSACGSAEQAQNALPPAPPPAPPPVVTGDGSVDLGGSPTIEEIKQRGKLLVGLRTDDPRMVQRAGAGQYRGFDVEIARLLATGIGLDPDTQISYRWLPPEVRTNAMTASSIDVQLGGFDPNSPQFAETGPYAVTGDGTEHYVGFSPGDDAMGDELRRILDAAVADGSWQRAYDSTLGAAGVPAHP
ncbi:transporter substrate-binding domain-containing protein [Saccharopolyspora taberi]|uniref:Solute-binding protein family 3/N-terminal domain-containing protein n=1 Tax=Saccharopolyspora taberi TaxID=60895 RepID=A0ABN3VGB2_9PSEU